jgi:hypothetical protein
MIAAIATEMKKQCRCRRGGMLLKETRVLWVSVHECSAHAQEAMSEMQHNSRSRKQQP